MGKWKKLTAFAPALAAVIVAACAGISLNGYTAPVYAVEQPEALVTPEPEQDTDAAEKKDDTKKKDNTKRRTIQKRQPIPKQNLSQPSVPAALSWRTERTKEAEQVLAVRLQSLSY